MRIGVSLLLITILMLLGLLKHTEKKNRGLEIKILKLEEEKKVHWNNKTLVCDTAEGELVDALGVLVDTTGADVVMVGPAVLAHHWHEAAPGK